jgi:hypothetical protein
LIGTSFDTEFVEGVMAEVKSALHDPRKSNLAQVHVVLILRLFFNKALR